MLLNLLVLLMIVGRNRGQIRLGARGHVVGGAGIEQPAKSQKRLPSLSQSQGKDFVLGHLQVNVLLARSTGEQVAVDSGLLHGRRSDGIALLEDLLRRRPLADEAGEPGLGAGLLRGLVDAVQDVAGRERRDGNVEARL